MEVEKKIYSFRLDADIVNQLQRYAEHHNRSLSNLIQSILKQYMEKQKNGTYSRGAKHHQK